MRVLFLSKSAPIIGGVESWLDDLACGLAERGHSCDVALAHGMRFHDPQRYAALHPRLRWEALDGRRGSPAARRLAVRSMLRSQRPDVVVPVMLFDGLLVAAATRERLGHRIVYPVHEACAGAASDLRRLGHCMDAAVPVDPASEAMVRDCAPGLRCVAIPCGIPAPDAEPVAAPSSAGAVPLRIGWCGRMQHSPKRVLDLPAVLLAVRKTIPGAVLRTAGDGEARGPLREQLAASGLQHAHEDLGAQDRDALARIFYPGIDVLLVTSESETGPLVAFEAMARGIAVVSADFRGRAAAGALRDGENCRLFPVGDTDAAARAIVSLHENPARREALRSHAAAWVRTARSLPAMLDAWEALLSDLRGGSAQSAAPPPRWREVLPPGERLREFGRALLRRRFVHRSLRAEWPFYGST